MAYRIDKTMDLASPFTLLGGSSIVAEHLRVDIPADGDVRAYFNQLCEVAIRHVSDLTGINPVAATYRVHVRTIPVRLELPFRASSITAVQYLKAGQTTYTALNASDHGIHGATAPSILFTRGTISAPSDADDDHPFPFLFTIAGLPDRERHEDAIQGADEDDLATDEDETADTPAVDHVPHAFIQACLIYVSHLYENRQAVVQGAKPHAVPLAFDHLVAQLRRIR